MSSLLGRLAQLGERCVRNAEVGSSILLPSTKNHLGAFVVEFPTIRRTVQSLKVRACR